MNSNNQTEHVVELEVEVEAEEEARGRGRGRGRQRVPAAAVVQPVPPEKSYDDNDTQNQLPEFTPTREAGLHLDAPIHQFTKLFFKSRTYQRHL